MAAHMNGVRVSKQCHIKKYLWSYIPTLQNSHMLVASANVLIDRKTKYSSMSCLLERLTVTKSYGYNMERFTLKKLQNAKISEQYHVNVTHQVLMVASMKMTAFWDIVT
jgi:hypothetical protein